MTRSRLVLPALLFATAALWLGPAWAQDVSYSGSFVVDVIADVEETTPYRFLYRDALVAGLRVSFATHRNNVVSAFSAALVDHGLRLQIDEARNMVFVLPLLPPPAAFARIRGTVSDAQSLERLPHATIMWKNLRGNRGATADDGGRFLVELGPANQPILFITSYLGYRSDSLYLDPKTIPGDLAIKLQARVVVGSEVVVSSPLLSSNLDSTWFYLLSASLATPTGEQSVTRALQALPAVGLTTAVSSGLNVRGSRTDGFQILLDGIPIYNQSHLFGMFDAFNPDALQTVDFYYGIAPARFQAPPGGTLSFLTRTGSKKNYKSRVGFTSTSFSGTAEGPAAAGKAGWIVSVRRSYLDGVNWFNNDRLVAVGLGVDRETSGTRRTPLDERVVLAAPPSAFFYDVHSKFEFESHDGATFHINLYVGGDKTAQVGERVVALGPQSQNRFFRSTVTTTNDWGNVAFSAHHRSAVHAWGYSHTYLGFTRYHSDFRKDDFFYRFPRQNAADPRLPFAPFLNDNSLSEARLAYESSVRLSPTLSGSAGFSTQRLVSLYDELSALRREFESDRRAWQLDAFAEASKRGRNLSVTLGIRPHYFSAGRYLRLSPRVTLAATVDSAFSASAGYARNYQFVHRLYIENAAGSDIWVLSSADEGPGASDHLTASLLYRGPLVTAQLEGFLKWQQNLRRHETLLRPSGAVDGAVLFEPWSHDNEARSVGLEALFTRRFRMASITATYTLSRTEIRHPDDDARAYFLADWDRPHQFAIHAHLKMTTSLAASLSWNIASGQPNKLAYANPAESTRLDTYRRVDLALQYHAVFHSFTLEGFFRIYNLFNRANTWYRTLETVVPGRGQNISLAFEPVDVFDLQLQPSVGLSISF